jgi:hypothetical protein
MKGASLSFLRFDFFHAVTAPRAASAATAPQRDSPSRYAPIRAHWSRAVSAAMLRAEQELCGDTLLGSTLERLFQMASLLQCVHEVHCLGRTSGTQSTAWRWPAAVTRHSACAKPAEPRHAHPVCVGTSPTRRPWSPMRWPASRQTQQCGSVLLRHLRLTWLWRGWCRQPGASARSERPIAPLRACRKSAAACAGSPLLSRWPTMAAAENQNWTELYLEYGTVYDTKYNILLTPQCPGTS